MGGRPVSHAADIDANTPLTTEYYVLEMDRGTGGIPRWEDTEECYTDIDEAKRVADMYLHGYRRGVRIVRKTTRYETVCTYPVDRQKIPWFHGFPSPEGVSQHG